MHRVRFSRTQRSLPSPTIAGSKSQRQRVLDYLQNPGDDSRQDLSTPDVAPKVENPHAGYPDSKTPATAD